MRLIATSAFLATAFLTIPASTSASTPEAWAQLDQRVVRACIAMSGLSRPQVLARKVSYSDVIGVEVRMLRGVERGVMQRKLCAYNRRTGRTEVQDAGGWFGGTVKP
jgi:hypothetical protein